MRSSLVRSPSISTSSSASTPALELLATPWIPGTFALRAADVAAGRPALRTVALEEELFEAAAMRAVDKDLMAMKVTELKEELGAREEPVSGNKAWLRRRLHAAIVRDHLEARDGGRQRGYDG